MSIKDFLKKNSSSICVGVGVGSMLAGGIAGMVNSPKAVDIIRAEEARLGRKLTLREKAALTWKYYILPGGLLAGGAAVTIIGDVEGRKASKKMQAALVSLYTLTDKERRELKEALMEKDPEKAKEIEDKIQEERDSKKKDISDSKESTEERVIINTGNGTYPCYDKLTGRYFYSNWQAIQDAQNKLNQDMIDSLGYCSLNELYYLIGLPDCDIGDIMGYNQNSGLIKIERDYGPHIDGQPCLRIDVSKNLTPTY